MPKKNRQSEGSLIAGSVGLGLSGLSNVGVRNTRSYQRNVKKLLGRPSLKYHTEIVRPTASKQLRVGYSEIIKNPEAKKVYALGNIADQVGKVELLQKSRAYKNIANIGFPLIGGAIAAPYIASLLTGDKLKSDKFRTKAQNIGHKAAPYVALAALPILATRAPELAKSLKLLKTLNLSKTKYFTEAMRAGMHSIAPVVALGGTAAALHFGKEKKASLDDDFTRDKKLFDEATIRGHRRGVVVGTGGALAATAYGLLRGFKGIGNTRSRALTAVVAPAVGILLAIPTAAATTLSEFSKLKKGVA